MLNGYKKRLFVMKDEEEDIGEYLTSLDNIEYHKL